MWQIFNCFVLLTAQHILLRNCKFVSHVYSMVMENFAVAQTRGEIYDHLGTHLEVMLATSLHTNFLLFCLHRNCNQW